MKFARIKVVLFARTLKDGTSPVCLRVTYRRKSKYFPLNKQCLPEQFDKSEGRFRKSYPEHRRDNDLLRTWEQKAADVLFAFEREGVTFTFDKFKQAFDGEDKGNETLWQYATETGEAVEAAGSVGNAEKYTSLSGILKSYRPAATFHDIDHIWLEKFERYLRKDRGNSDGGVAFTLRTLRALCNRAIKQGKMPVGWYPFRTYKIAAPEYVGGARALTRDDIRKFEVAEGLNERQRYAVDLFLLSFYLRGANMADLARLRPSDMQGGRITYVREKTGKVYSIPVSPKVEAIFLRYKPIEYLLPNSPQVLRKKRRETAYTSPRGRQIRESGKWLRWLA